MTTFTVSWEWGIVTKDPQISKPNSDTPTRRKIPKSVDPTGGNFQMDSEQEGTPLSVRLKILHTPGYNICWLKCASPWVGYNQLLSFYILGPSSRQTWFHRGVRSHIETLYVP